MNPTTRSHARYSAFHYAAGGSVALSLVIAAAVIGRGERDAQRFREQVRFRSRMTLIAARDGLEDYLSHVVLTVRAFALHPSVSAMRTDARDYLQALYDGSYDEHQLAEIYVIQRGFDGTAPPFMTFEKGENDEPVEQTHILAHEQAEYREQMQQITQFGAQPDLAESVSPLVQLCVGSPGFIFSVPVRERGELRGIVAGMIASERLMDRVSSSGLRGDFVLALDRESALRTSTVTEASAAEILAALRRSPPEAGVDGIEELTAGTQRLYVAALRSFAFRRWKLVLPESLPEDAPAATLGSGAIVGALIVLLGCASGYLLVLTPRLIRARRDAERAGRQERELAHAARVATAGQMTTGLAHELNQPLTAIVNYAHALRERAGRGEVPASDLAAGLTQIQSQATRAGEIVRYVRDFVRKSPGRGVAADLNALVRETVEFVQAGEQRRGPRLIVDCAEGLSAVRVDPVAIQQVLINLVRNAQEALAESGAPDPEIVIRTSRAAGTVCCEVADNGAVLTPAEMQRMFAPFQSTKPDGLGIGLALSRSIIEAHNGSLTAAPRAPRGASFRFTLPILEDADVGS